HQLDLGLAFQAIEPAFQRRFRAPQRHVVDLAVPQIAKRGGVAFAAGEKMFVYAQHGRTARRPPFAELALQAAPEIPLDRGRPDPLPPPQPAAVDPVQVMAVDHLLKALAGALAAQNPRQALPRLPPAAPAAQLPCLDLQVAAPQSPVLMPHHPPVAPAAPHRGRATVSAGSGPAIAGPEPDPIPPSLPAVTLKVGQTQQNLCTGQNRSPKTVLPVPGSWPAPVVDQEPSEAEGLATAFSLAPRVGQRQRCTPINGSCTSGP